MKMTIVMLISIFGLFLFNLQGDYKEVKNPDKALSACRLIETLPDSVVEVKLESVVEKQYFKGGLITKKEGFTPQHQLVYSYPYANGIKHGTWKEYYTNGKLYSEVDYFFGERNGLQKVYYSDGTYQYWVEWINGVQLCRLETPRPNDVVLVAPRWKMDGC